jgi:hypothetical protein
MRMMASGGSIIAARRMWDAAWWRTGASSRLHRAFALLTAAAALIPGSASATQGYVARDLGEWTVAESRDKQGCFLTRTYAGPGGTTLLLGLDADGSNRLTILNANWSIADKEQVKLTFRLSNASFPRHLSVGIAADGKQGFVTSFGTAFPASFAASKFLNVLKGDVPVAELSLDGSGAAVADLRKCAALQRTAANPAAGEVRGSRIPLDPFAPEAPRKRPK